MGVGNLRVINEDRIAPGTGFGTHGHRDMEIVSYVLSGELGHKDSIGNGAAIRPGDVQRMSAGSGIQHSEFNHAPGATTHFLQIWIQPNVRGIAPGYEQKHFADADKRGRLRLVASDDGREGSVTHPCRCGDVRRALRRRRGGRRCRSTPRAMPTCSSSAAACRSTAGAAGRRRGAPARREAAGARRRPRRGGPRVRPAPPEGARPPAPLARRGLEWPHGDSTQAAQPAAVDRLGARSWRSSPAGSGYAGFARRRAARRDPSILAQHQPHPPRSGCCRPPTARCAWSTAS